MEQAVRVLVLLLVGGAAVTGCGALAAWWFEPARRTARALNRVLGAPPDSQLLAPVRGQGAALRLATGQIGVVRGLGDPGLVFQFDELIGAELVFDGEVCARAFRGEGRRALDQVHPEVGEVMLRLVFDDVREPEFELELWSAADPDRAGHDGPGAVQAARKWFGRLEAILRR